MEDKRKHPKNDNFEVLNTMLVDPEHVVELKDCFYTDNIYISAYLKAKGFVLVCIQKSQDKRTTRLFSHFWFDGIQDIKKEILAYHNNRDNNINASDFVSALQSIKKILNMGKLNRDND